MQVLGDARDSPYSPACGGGWNTRGARPRVRLAGNKSLPGSMQRELIILNRKLCRYVDGPKGHTDAWIDL